MLHQSILVAHKFGLYETSSEGIWALLCTCGAIYHTSTSACCRSGKYNFWIRCSPRFQTLSRIIQRIKKNIKITSYTFHLFWHHNLEVKTFTTFTLFRACTICSHSLCRAVVFRSTCDPVDPGPKHLMAFGIDGFGNHPEMCWKLTSISPFCKFSTWQMLWKKTLSRDASCDVPKSGAAMKSTWSECSFWRRLPSLFITFSSIKWNTMSPMSPNMHQIGCSSKFLLTPELRECSISKITDQYSIPATNRYTYIYI